MSFLLFFSTWEDADKNCYDPNDTVIFNIYPETNGFHNFNLQRISTLTGILKAKELGFDRVIKWRGDFITNNATELVKLFKDDYLNFYAFINDPTGYVTDFFMEGDVDDMLELFNIMEIHGYPFPEFLITKRLYTMGLNNKVNFICRQLTQDTNIYWKKMNYWLTDNKQYPVYTDSLPEITNQQYL